MKTLFLATTLVLAVALSSFTLISGHKIASFQNFGTYLGGGTMETSPIQLQLQNDFSYSYKDLSHPNKKIEITGTWKQDGKHIYLLGHAEVRFHNTWKIDPGCTCLKSKKGITFYRLCQ